MASKWFSFVPPTVNRLVTSEILNSICTLLSEGKFISHSGQAINALGQGRLTSFYSSDKSAPDWNSRDPRFGTGIGHPTFNEETPPPIASVSGHATYLDMWRFPEENRVQNPITDLKDYVRMVFVSLLET